MEKEVDEIELSSLDAINSFGGSRPKINDVYLKPTMH